MILKLFILFSLFATTTFGQDLDYTRTVINKLTSEKFYGRGYVKHGDKIAANYLADEFKSIGLLPVEKSYFQNFSFSVNTFPKKINFHCPSLDSTKPSLILKKMFKPLV